MKITVLKTLLLLFFISIFSFNLGAEGLQDYLQKPETTNGVVASGDIIDSSSLSSVDTIPSSKSELTYFIELIVAGIVASALILSILVLFLGRMAGNREKKKIKAIRVEAEKEKEHIISASTTVKAQEKETIQLVNNLKDDAQNIAKTRTLVEKYEHQIAETSENVKQKENELKQVTENVTGNLGEIQSYWETQLDDTVSTIKELQENLDSKVNEVDQDIEKMRHQKDLSQELLQDFLDRHNEQGNLINKNADVSQAVSESLDETLKESKQLIQLLKQHQENAEKSLKKFTDELTVYEEQAYEQFDTSFQVADLARQELTANIDESRKHIETMRRYEEQSHSINTQTQKNLELLDYSKIVKLSNTLDTTQDLFTDMRSRVAETKLMLDELKDIETDIRKTASNVENVVEKTKIKDYLPPEKTEHLDDLSEEFSDEVGGLLDDVHLQKNLDSELPPVAEEEYKMVSGDNAPISFFKNIKQK